MAASQQFPSGQTENLPVLLRRLRQVLRKPQKHVGGDPLVGMMGGRVENFSIAVPGYQGPHGPLKDRGGGQFLAAQEG